MNCSASSSSSSVVTPGRTCSPISSRVSTTTRPAFSIFSISAGDLRMITVVSEVWRSSPRLHVLECVLDLGENFVDRTVAADRDDVAARPVVLDQRLGLLVVDAQPVVDRLGRVVVAAFEPRSLEQPAARDFVRDLQREDDVELAADLPQHLVERLRLCIVARKAVEDEAVLRIVLLQTFADQLDHQIIGNEVAAVVD